MRQRVHASRSKIIVHWCALAPLLLAVGCGGSGDDKGPPDAAPAPETSAGGGQPGGGAQPADHGGEGSGGGDVVLEAKSFDELFAEAAPGFRTETTDAKTLADLLDESELSPEETNAFHLVEEPLGGRTLSAVPARGASCDTLSHFPSPVFTLEVGLGLLAENLRDGLTPSSDPLHSLSILAERPAWAGVAYKVTSIESPPSPRYESTTYVGSQGAVVVVASETRTYPPETTDQPMLDPASVRCVGAFDVRARTRKLACSRRQASIKNSVDTDDLYQERSYAAGALKNLTTWTHASLVDEKFTVSSRIEQTGPGKTAFELDFREAVDPRDGIPYIGLLRLASFAYASGEMSRPATAPCTITSLRLSP
jgi:hypothetical protein